MTRYARDTQVSSTKSRNEIEQTLNRYGATGFLYGTAQEKAVIMFEMCGKRIKFLLPMPDPESDEIRLTPAQQYTRSQENQERAYEQAVRQRWRALALCIKAKLEAVESGITQFEEEFLPHIVLPDGRTIAEAIIPQIEHSYQTGKMPPLLEHGK